MRVFQKSGKKQSIVIFGAAETAELAAFYFNSDSEFHVSAFVVDDEYLDEDLLNGIPIVPWSEALVKFPPSIHKMHIALSYKQLNKLREQKFHQALSAKYELVSYISSKSVNYKDLVLGRNCFILENQTIQPSVVLGDNVMIWSGNHIGHGSTIGDHSYLASHIVVSGHVKIGKRCFIGVNAAIRDFVSISDDCFVAMSTSVTRNLEPGSVVLPPRSEILNGSDERALQIVKKTFEL